jgi:hypothetical protein
MTDLAAALLDALRGNRQGPKMLTHEEIAQHPLLGEASSSEIEGAVKHLAGLGAVEPHHEIGSRSPYDFDWIGLLPTDD